ncbi:MAG: energy transducer TonB [Gammaproteobacteria bacterium]|nr:energy transducer TonB [Gammaproteobacteria bacterium]
MATLTDTIENSKATGVVRLVTGAVLAIAITLVLLWTMQFLIRIAEQVVGEKDAGHTVDFIRIKRSETPQRRKIKPKKPPPPEQPPPEPTPPKLDRLQASADKIAISAVPAETSIELSGGFSIGNIGEGDYLPIVKVAPIYPQRAVTRGIEGFCVVQYTVTRQGTVRDPSVVDGQCTSSLFHRASLQAALKFKYKPRVVDGEAREVPGVRNKFTYQLEDQ